jgi:hypothetical protein
MSNTEIIVMVIGSTFAFGGIIYATVTVRKTLNEEM